MAYGITSASLDNARKTRQEQSASLAKDLALAIPRGVEGTIQSTYQLADWATGDRLPDYESKFLGTSDTVVGGLAEGVAQFASGFIPIAGGVGAIANGAKWGSRLLKAGKHGKQVLNWKGLLTAEVATDFVAFRAQEARLSNLVQMFPQLENPLTEFLSAQDDDGELEGRLKNSLEGLGISGIMAPVMLGLSKAVKKYRKGDVRGADKEVQKVAPLMRSVVSENTERSWYGDRVSGTETQQILGIDRLDKMDDETVIGFENIASLKRLVGETGKKISEAPVKDVLGALAVEGSDDFVRGFAKSMLKLGKKDNEFLDTPIRTLIEESGAGGTFHIDRNTGEPIIELHTNRGMIKNGELGAKADFQETTILHEIVHAGIAQKLPVELTSIGDLQEQGIEYLMRVDDWLANTSTDDFAYGLVKAYRTALDNIPSKYAGMIEDLNAVDDMLQSGAVRAKDSLEWYGFSNLDEFVSEALTNKQFQSYLKSIPSEGPEKTLWDSVMNFFRNVFGKDVEGTLLDDVVGSFGNLMRSNREKWGPEAFDFGYKDSVMPSRSATRYRMRSLARAGETISRGLEDVKLDVGEGRGGAIALKGTSKVLREASTTNDIEELLKQGEEFMLENLDATPKLTKDALERGGIMQAVDRLAEASGTNKDILMSEVSASGDDANALRRIASRLYTVESLAVQQADHVYESAVRLSELGARSSDADRALFVGELKKLVEITRAGTKLRRGFGQGLRSTQFDRAKLSLTEADIRSTDIVGEYLANNTGKNFNDILNKVLLSGDPQDAVNQMLGIAKIARNAEPRGVMETAQNWFVNSLLSGPRTMVKNGLGNTMANVLLNVETAIGGLATNPAVTSQVLKEFMTLDSFRESMQYFLKSWKMKDQLLDVGRSPLENTRRTKIPLVFEGASSDETFKNALNWIGENIINSPTRTLSSMDEVFKQAMFRQRSKLELAMKAMELGMKDPAQISEYVTRGLDALLINGERAWSKAGVIKHAHAKAKEADEALLEAGAPRMKPSERGVMIDGIIRDETDKRVALSKSFDEGGLGIKNLAELDQMSGRALEKARYATFTNDAGKFAELVGGMTQTVPVLKFIFPFVRTPVNLIKFSLDRATFAGPEIARNVMANLPDLPMLKQTQERLRTQLQSRDPLEKADAIGKMATSVMINTTLLSLAMANRDLITGGGPKDINEKKNLEATGWQPYSFHVGNKYYSYNGLDPIGAHFGILVDILDQMDDPTSTQSTAVETALTAVMISATRNITEKSYLTGLKVLTDAFSAPEDKLPKMIQGLTAGFVPNILYQGQSVVGDVTVREARSVGDAILKKLPSGADNLDPKRNILGEAVQREQVKFVGPFNPSAISTRDNDRVLEELAKLHHGFSNPSHVLDGIIDMTRITDEMGRTAHDRRLEHIGTVKIGGKTLRQALDKLVRSKGYQRLSAYSEGGFTSPRVEHINKILSRYRQVALHKTFKDFPELKQQYSAVQRAEKLAVRGASPDALSNLLSFN